MTYDPVVISHARSLLAKSPGVVPVRLWTGDTPVPDHKAPTATFLAGVARKP